MSDSIPTTKYPLGSCTLEVGAPVRVGSARGHHWFSTLHALGGSDVLCEVVLTDDRAQGKWPAKLYLSRDRGRTFTYALDIESYGPTSYLLSRGKLLLMPYELWPLSPGDKRNAVADGTLITLGKSGPLSAKAQPIKYLGFPRDLADYHVGELCLLTNGNILPLRDGRLFTTVYGQFAGDSKYTNFAVTSDDRGLTWRFKSIVAGWKDAPDTGEGPDESNTVRLEDGRLLCIYRVGGEEYRKSYSADEGATWTKPEKVTGAWAVEPQLASLKNGLILLSGGRPGLHLWVCADRKGERWERLNLGAHHNATIADPSLQFSQQFCEGAGVQPAQSTSYTGMLKIGPNEVLICYDRLGNGWTGAPGPWGEVDAVFCVRAKAVAARSGGRPQAAEGR